jgi:hypothetical protein
MKLRNYIFGYEKFKEFVVITILKMKLAYITEKYVNIVKRYDG